MNEGCGISDKIRIASARDAQHRSIVYADILREIKTNTQPSHKLVSPVSCSGFNLVLLKMKTENGPNGITK